MLNVKFYFLLRILFFIFKKLSKKIWGGWESGLGGCFAGGPCSPGAGPPWAFWGFVGVSGGLSRIICAASHRNMYVESVCYSSWLT